MLSVSGSQPLKILVVSEDRPLHRQLSQFLTAVGYQVLQAAGPHSAMAAVEAENPQIVLLELDLAARSNWALCDLLSKHQQPAGPIKLLLVEEPNESKVEEALEAGIDDFLRAPIDFGELLTRLRAAARLFEFDRRVCQQSHTDPRTGLLSRPALLAQLRRQWAGNGGAPPRISCAVVDIDFATRINQLQGAAAGNALVHAVVGELNKLRVGSEILGCLGGDRFCALLPGASAKAAVEWAENARQAVAAAKYKLGETTWQVTASVGIASSETADDPERLIQQATEAVQTAKTSGRNCVVRYGEFSGDSQESTEELLKHTTAKDVMMPCTVFLRSNEPLGEAIELLGRTQLDAIPVVDADGTLLGLCEQEDVATLATSDSRTRLIRDVMTTDVQTFDERKSLNSLLEFFTRDPRRLVVVVRDSRPVGFVTCSSLATLWQPLTTASFAAEVDDSGTSDYLLVPEVCEQHAQQKA